MKKPTLRLFLFLMGFLALNACSHLIHLDRAQDAFSRGAEMENQARLIPGSVPLVGASGYYSVAYREIQEALKDQKELENDTILANALALKALTEWKLKRYDAARNTAKIALLEFNGYHGAGIYLHRDEAVIEALEGLIRIDEVNDTLNPFFARQELPLSDIQSFYESMIHQPEQASGKIESALSIIETAKGKAGKDHEVQTYLLMAQLAGMKAWSDVLSELENRLDGSTLPADQLRPSREAFGKYYANYKPQKDEYLDMLAKKLPQGTQDQAYLYWKMLLLP